MSEYHIKTKKSNELLENEWVELTAAFNIVFIKNYNTDYFKTKYLGSTLGYSIHGFLIYKDQIVGMFSAIPRKYFLNGKEVIIALGCDAFILKAHRKDEFFLKKMSDEVIEKFKELNVNHIISIPNPTAYPYWKHYGGWKDLGSLDYYIIPLNISKLVGKYKKLDILSKFVFKSIINFCVSLSLLSKKNEVKRIYLIRNTEYFKQRFPKEYNVRIIKNELFFVYRIYNENNIRTAYLIDCYPKSKANIANSINHIIKDTKGKIDTILFIGKMDNPPFFFLKVPKKKEPRRQPFIGLSNDESSDSSFFSIDLWDVSLANFDNR